VEREYFRIMDDPEGLKRDLLASAEGMAEAIEPFIALGVDGIAIGTDYGHNTGPFMSPRHFREIYFPAMRRQCEIIHAAGKPVLFHSCGNNRLILEMMIEAGMDCYQAIQPVERIEEIKRLYGDRLTLWGGVATSSLASAAEEQIRQEVLFSLKHCAPGGGFILGSSHSLTIGTRPQNYRMMLDTNRRFGAYPISIPQEIPEPAWAMA
jgi:uroporphyrinogen-III decarboxylase